MRDASTYVLRVLGFLLLLHVPAACTSDDPDATDGSDRSDAPDASVAEASADRTTVAPPGTDVWAGELRSRGDSLTVTGLVNVTRRAGYDNQPAFLPNGDGFLYTVVDSSGGADVWRYDLGSGRTEPVTRTRPESEYSPTPLPDGDGFSAVRVEADSSQRLWRFDLDGTDPSVLYPEVEPVGYHAWAGREWTVMFVLGDPPSLRAAHASSGEVREIARDVGRSIQSIPGRAAVSFVQRDPDGDGSRMMRWSEATGATRITETPEGGDDHAWTPEGVLLMGSGREIRGWSEAWDGWRTVGVVPAGSVTRMAVSPDGSRIAVVVDADAPDEGG